MKKHTTTAHSRHLATESASASAPSSESMTSSMVNCCGNPCTGTGVPGSSRALIAFPVAMPACSAVELPASGCPLIKNSTEASGSVSQRQKAAVTCSVPVCRHYQRPSVAVGLSRSAVCRGGADLLQWVRGQGLDHRWSAYLRGWRAGVVKRHRDQHVRHRPRPSCSSLSRSATAV